MRRFTFIFACLCPTLCYAQSWSGNYAYEETYGQDTGAVLEYQIAISETKCEIEISGYQTDKEILCQAEKTPDSLKLNFIRYRSGSVKNKYGVQIYKQNSELLVLSQEHGSLITTWKGLRNAKNKTPKPGSYFEKVASDEKQP